MPILEVHQLSKRFGGVEALSQVDLTVEAGEVIGVIGPNGAGKSTFFNLLSGVMKPSDGKVVFQGHDVTGMKPHGIAKRGLVRTFQGTVLFSDLSVFDNVLVASHVPARANLVADVIGLPAVRRRDLEMRQRAEEIVELAGLTAVRTKLARTCRTGTSERLASPPRSPRTRSFCASTSRSRA